MEEEDSLVKIDEKRKKKKKRREGEKETIKLLIINEI